MQHHKAKKAGVIDRQFDPELPDHKVKKAKEKLSADQTTQFQALLEHMTYAELSVLYETATPEQRELIMEAADKF